MVPEEPTLTNNPVELVEPSSLLLQEMKVKLKRNTEKMIRKGVRDKRNCNLVSWKN